MPVIPTLGRLKLEVLELRPAWATIETLSKKK
jgi:hypothetical protein